MGRKIGIRWTIGDVDPRGFDALRLSILGAWRLFGDAAAYAVVVNTVGLEEARARTGPVPGKIEWCRPGAIPAFLRRHLDEGMAEGVAWKFAPLRCFPDRWELSLDNDCILWAMPEALRLWLGEEEEDAGCLIAEDTACALGAFADLCGNLPRNSGIRGLPPGYDIARAMKAVLDRRPVVLASELDEQGLQVAAVGLARPPRVVSVSDVTICSPFWPQIPELGRCGAHFVGLNARGLPWDWYGTPATDCIDENWRRHLPELRRLTEPARNGGDEAGLNGREAGGP